MSALRGKVPPPTTEGLPIPMPSWGSTILALALLLAAPAQAALDRIVQVSARTAWLATAITVGEGDEIRPTGGSWTTSPTLGMSGAEGHAGHPAREGFALPGAPEGALVARVCDTVFLVGAGTRVPQGLSGALYLAINDEPGRTYGRGFRDNRGRVTVAIRSRGNLPRGSCKARAPEAPPTAGNIIPDGALGEARQLLERFAPQK